MLRVTTYRECAAAEIFHVERGMSSYINSLHQHGLRVLLQLTPGDQGFTDSRLESSGFRVQGLGGSGFEGPGECRWRGYG